MLLLYYAPGTCALATHVALEEAGAAYQTRPLNLATGEHKQAEYLSINPAGEVPALAIGETILTQSVAILNWIADEFPAAKLVPNSPLERAQVVSLLAWLASFVHPNFKPQWASLFGDPAAKDPQRLAQLREQSEAHLARIDSLLAGKPWVFGEFSVADAYLLPFYRWAADVFRYDMSKFPNYSAHYRALLERPAVQRVLARESAAVAKAA